MSNKLKLPLNGAQEFVFNLRQLNEVGSNCNIMKTFLHTEFFNLRKFQKNYAAIVPILEGASEEQQALQLRAQKLNEKYNNDFLNPEFLRLKEDHEKAFKAFNDKKFKVNLFTMPEADFPNNKKFMEEVKDKSEIKAYLELLGLVITETEE